MKKLLEIGFVCVVLLVGCERGAVVQKEIEVASQQSPNQAVTALVIKREEGYRFGIRGKDGSTVLLQNEFVPGGYHDPIIKLKWSARSDKVFITVDHDFGEGNLTFVYDLVNVSWQISKTSPE